MPNNAATASPAPIGQAPTAPNTTPTARPTDSWTIGLLDQPRSLLPYQHLVGQRAHGRADQRAAVPIAGTSYAYGYTGTGVLERIPRASKTATP